MFNYRILAIATTLLAAPLMSQATTYQAADPSVASRLCVSAATDSAAGFYANVRLERYKLSYLAQHLQCNDQPVADFAADAGQHRVAKRLQLLQPHRGRTEIKDVAARRASDGMLNGTVRVAGR